MRLIIVLLILFSNSCAWSDVSSYQHAKYRYEEKKLEAAELNGQLLGFGKEAVEKVLGKPRRIIREPSPYLADQNCTGSKCEKKWADEVWFYERLYKDESGRYVYSINVYFAEGKVVQIY